MGLEKLGAAAGTLVLNVRAIWRGCAQISK